MAGIVLGLIAVGIHAATGSKRDRRNNKDQLGAPPPYYSPSYDAAPCACQVQGSCRLCAVDPVFMSRREVRRELKYERRALKHARKAARWGAPVAVYHSHSHSPQQQQSGFVQPPPQQQQQYQQQGFQGVSAGQVPRRASFDEEDVLGQPPQYEPGEGSQQRLQQRRSVEVLTSDRKN